MAYLFLLIWLNREPGDTPPEDNAQAFRDAFDPNRRR